MGKVTPTWLLPGHSGRPCHHESIYTRQARQTGQIYSVKLCNPNTNVTEAQAAQRDKFGTISSALAAWINTNEVDSAADHAVYKKLLAQFKRQHKCLTLRGYMSANKMAEIQEDGNVKITIGTYSVVLDSMGNPVDTGDDSGNQGGNAPARRTLTLIASPTNGGNTIGAGQYDEGATATITAVPASGFTFSRWSDGNTNASRTVTVNGNMTLTAIFNSSNPIVDPEGDDEEGGEGSGNEFGED